MGSIGADTQPAMGPFYVAECWIRRTSNTEQQYYFSPEEALLAICEESDKTTGGLISTRFHKDDPFLKIEKLYAVVCNGVVARSIRKQEKAEAIARQFNLQVDCLNGLSGGESLEVGDLFNRL